VLDGSIFGDFYPCGAFSMSKMRQALLRNMVVSEPIRQEVRAL
jgi:hypothetical protein